jgi:mannonate dehydratase
MTPTDAPSWPVGAGHPQSRTVTGGGAPGAPGVSRLPRIALGQFAVADDETLAFAAQLGVTGVSLNTPRLPGERRWEVDDLRALRERCESRGLALEGIENVPLQFYERALTGRPGRDEDLEHLTATIRNVGAAGIPVLGLHFLPGSVWRTAVDDRGRGGAVVSSFDQRDAGDVASAYVARRERGLDDPFVRGARIERAAGDGVAAGAPGAGAAADDTSAPERLDEDTMWANFTAFVRAIAPAAEEAGVRIALHPDDPPVPELDGIARILRDVAGLRRALEIADSPAVGLNLCLGTLSAAGGQDEVLDAVRRFGLAGQIVCVHFRDVRGVGPAFEECFLGEGNFDPPRVMRTLVGTGFDGFVIDDHVPRIVGDGPYAHRGRAHATGYLQGLLATVLSEKGTA